MFLYNSIRTKCATCIVPFSLLLVLVFFLGGCFNSKTPPEQKDKNSSSKKSLQTLNIYAAISLKEGLLEIGREFSKVYKWKLSYNFASSNTLAQQILATPQTDIFLSANPYWSQKVHQQYPQISTPPKPFLSNQLVLIINSQNKYSVSNKTSSIISDGPLKKQNPQDLCSLFYTLVQQGDLLAIGNPQGVPAGQYAKAWLQSVSCAEPSMLNKTLWTIVKKNILPTSNVRHALHYVETQKNVWGIVYQTDYQSSIGIHTNKIKSIYTVPNITHNKKQKTLPFIQYVLLTFPIQNSGNSEATEAFSHFLTSPTAIEIWKKHKFQFTPQQDL